MYVFCFNAHFHYYFYVKPWPNGLASRRKFWTCVKLAFRLATHLRGLASTCDDLRGLAWTCVDFGRAQIWSPYASSGLQPLALRWLASPLVQGFTLVELRFGVSSFLPFSHPAQVNTNWSQIICYQKNALTNDMREISGFLRLASRLVNPFGHPWQDRTQVLVLQICVYLRVRLANRMTEIHNLSRMVTPIKKHTKHPWYFLRILTLFFKYISKIV